MTFRNPRVSLLALAAAALVSLAVFACNLASEDGHTFLRIKKDAAWSAYDTLEITWKDTVSGDSGTLFLGKPADLAADEKLPADGYHGQKIVITLKGFNAHKLTYEELRNFDGANPSSTDRIVVAIKPVVVDSPKVIDTTTVPPVIVKDKPKPPRLTPILAEPTISIHDSESFLADVVLDSGSLKAYAWDYDGDGKFEDSLPITGKSARIKGGFVYHTQGIFKVTLKAVSDADSVGTSQVTVTVLQDEPIAFAGGDTTVYPKAIVRLHGRGKDGMGRIVKTEWKIGGGIFAEAPGDTSITAPSVLQDLQAIFRITDDDTLSVSDTMTIHIISANESNLTGIVFSKGALAPQFNPAVFAYTDTVPYDLATLTVTPTGNGLITVNDAVTASGQASGPLDIKPGANSVVIVTKLSGAAAKTYSVNVYRPSPSANVNLKTLRVRAGGLDTVVVPKDAEYRFNTATAIDTALISLSLEDTLSNLSVKSPAIAAGSGTWKFPLVIGANTLPVAVTAQNGLAKTYTLILTRAAPVDTTTSHMTGLAVSKGVLSPVFNPAVSAYADTLTADVGSFTVTPTGNGNITVNGASVQSGQASQPISVNPGSTVVVPIKVQYGTAPEKTYSLSVFRPVALSSNADLSSLFVVPGAMDYPFSPGDSVYAVATANTDSLVSVTATTADTAARFLVTPASPVPLKVGSSSVSVQVTARNGAKKTYAITIIRAAPPSGNANLATLVVSAGPLDTAFRAGDTLYKVSVANTVLSSNLTASVADTTAQMRISPVPPLNLNVGANVISVTVTAQNGTKKTYAVTIPRAASANANLATLSASPWPLDTSFNVNDTLYNVYLGNPTTTANLTATVADTTARLVISPASPFNLKVGANVVSATVTAQNGTKKSYAVTYFRAQSDNADLATLDFSMGALNPAFTPGTTAYTVEGTDADATLSATVADTTARFTVSPSPINLNLGANAVTVTVTAQSGVKKIYTITATRKLKVTAIAANGFWSMALKEDGTVVAWGDNGMKQTNVPAGLTDVKAIAAGYDHGLALKNDGSLVCWGDNDHGECDIPPALTGVKVKAVTAGQRFTFALKEDGTVIGWGAYMTDMLKMPDGLTGIQAIGAGDACMSVSLADGSVVAWGNTYYGQTTVPSGLIDVKVLSSSYHTMALKGDGTVVAWGNNTRHEIEVPAGLTGALGIAAGAYHSVAIKSNGMVTTWGDDGDGQSSIPFYMKGIKVKAVAAGALHTVVLRENGTVAAWGNNGNTQSTVPTEVK